MPTFAMLTRLTASAVQSPSDLEELEHKVKQRIRNACPSAQWIGSYAVLGPCDYLDIFKAETQDDATKIATLIRSYGHAHTEVWPLTEWTHFKAMMRDLSVVRGAAAAS